MSLRTKCALLLIAFELTLAVTLLFTVRYIGAYFDDAAQTLALTGRTGVELGRLRVLIRTEFASVQGTGSGPSASDTAGELSREIQTLVDGLRRDSIPPLAEAHLVELERRLATSDAAVRAYRAHRLQGDGEGRFDPDGPLAVDAYLGELEAHVNSELRRAVEASFLAQKDAAIILSINMIVAAGIGILGMVLVRRWVLLPIQALKDATDEYGQGRLAYRARVVSRDELGQLADALNRMSSDLTRIERQMVLRERAAAMGELISYIAHNIRNPLAGIRSLVDSCQRRISPESELRAPHAEIIAAIERLQRWLRELEHVCKPLEIQPGSVEIQSVVENIIAVFKPMADRRSVGLCHDTGPAACRVPIDERHFEQAVAAVVGNAIEASSERGTVRIGVAADDRAAQWSLWVSDDGTGIPDAFRDRVFDPTFTTKREGRGLGLAMARRVAELHGGRLVLETPEGGGTVFRFVMPLAKALN